MGIMHNVYFERISPTEYRATEKRGNAKIISFVKMWKADHSLSDVRKKYKNDNRIKL